MRCEGGKGGCGLSDAWGGEERIAVVQREVIEVADGFGMLPWVLGGDEGRDELRRVR